MSSLTTEQYLALSQFSYNNFNWPADENKTIATLLGNPDIEHKGEPVLAALSTTNAEGVNLSEWRLVGFQSNTDNGFAGMAFENTVTGEQVFTFRGTEPHNGFNIFMDDVATDINVAIGRLPNQFTEAEAFFNSVQADHPSINVSFTGHSLGGAIAQFMTYATDGMCYSETFNAISPVPIIKSINPAFDDQKWATFYDRSVDHVSSNDWVGMYQGADLGETRRYIDNADISYNHVNYVAIATMLYIRLQLFQGTITSVVAAEQLKATINTIETGTNGYTRSDTIAVYNGYCSEGGDHGDGFLNTSYHGLEHFLEDDPNIIGDQYIMTQRVGQQAGLTQLQDMFQLMNAMRVVEQAKNVDHNYDITLSSNQIPAKSFTSNGVVYFLIDESTQYKYNNAQIAYANYTIHRLEGKLQTIAMAVPGAIYQQAGASNIRRVDPLILDLDGDGTETVSINNSNAYFDLDLNGFAEKTSWASGDDGFLVLDRNNDGVINNATELFGDRTPLDDGVTYATSGFQALAEYDDNIDGVIDANDSIYSDLRVWQDANGDGVSALSELKSLASFAIVSIGLNYLNTGITDSANNIQVRTGSFERDDGTTGAIGEYLFNRDTANSIDEAPTDLPAVIAALPNISGAGNVSSLHKAMLNDTSGVLQSLVEAFVAENDVVARSSLMQQIIIKWTGSDSVVAGSRGSFFDAQKLAVMEKFFGVSFNGNPITTNAANLLTSAYSKLYEGLYVSLIAKAQYKGLLDSVDIDAFGNPSFVAVETAIDNQLVSSQSDGLVTLGEFARIFNHYGLEHSDGFLSFRNHYAIRSEEYAKAIDFAGTRVFIGTSGNDSLSINGDYNAIYAGDGNDTLYANTTSNVVLYAGAGDDVLVGSAGNDTLDGGTGNDLLQGTYGNDTYIFGRGYGNDRIYDYDRTAGNIDTVQFTAGITPDDITITRVNNADGDLILSIKGTTDTLKIQNYFLNSIDNPVAKVEQFKFADGTTWTHDHIKESLRTFTGTDGNDININFGDQDLTAYGLAGDDVLYGSGFVDKFYGGEGNDILYSQTGNDTLDGGTGNDTLKGGTGNDTYIFGSGYGQDIIDDYDSTAGNVDTVQFAEGINPDDITGARIKNSNAGGDLVIGIKGTGDSLTIQSYYSYEGITGTEGKVEQFKFADGTTWTNDNIKDFFGTYTGTAGNDTNLNYDEADLTAYGLAGDDHLNGSSFIDKLYGGEGNDVLYSQAGNDILDGGSGDDVLGGGAGNDTYIFGRGYGSDLVYENDSTAGNVDTIQFAEGINPEDITATYVDNRITGGDLVLGIKGTSDALTVESYFARGIEVKVEQFKFVDGTTWTNDNIKEFFRTYTGTNGNDRNINFGDQDLTAYGLGGDDFLMGSDFVDKLYGGDGNDRLYGGMGNDTLDGGAGEDSLQGDPGNDTYIFGRGYGVDTIQDLDGMAGNVDTVQFAEGITPDDISITRANNSTGDLILGIKGTNDTLIVQYYFDNDIYGTRGKVEQFKFADGTTWTADNINESSSTYTGTDGNDVYTSIGDQNLTAYGLAGDDVLNGSSFVDKLYGGDGDDVLNGFSGTDTLDGGTGNDTLDGGTGSDTLRGGAGNDTYIFGRGYGADTISDPDATVGNQDVIQFTAGVAPSDIIVKRRYDDSLEVQISGTDDKLVIERYFSRYYYSDGANTDVGEGGNKVELMKFADGTVWTIADVAEKAQTIMGSTADDRISGLYDQSNKIYGLEGNDVIYGANYADTLIGGAGNDILSGNIGDDILDGGTGNDRLYGGVDDSLYQPSYGTVSTNGNDTYIFGRGYGTDTISDPDSIAGNQDVIQFTAGVGPNDVIVKRNGDNLELQIQGTDDKLVIERYFSSYNYANYNNSYVGEDGNKVELVKFADGTIWTIADVIEQTNTIYGSDTADTITGLETNDIVKALGGDDTVYGLGGNDKIDGGAGNDALYGGAGNDVLNGQAGNDTLNGGIGNDTYVFGRGYGQDLVYNYDSTAGNVDTVQFAEGITPDDITATTSSSSMGDSNLVLGIKGTTDTLTVQGYLNGGINATDNAYRVEQFKFANGTTWTTANIKDFFGTYTGTAGNDSYTNYAGQDQTIYGLAGNDYLNGSEFVDKIYGGDGNDSLYGGGNNDILDGGAGDDTLYGSMGNDTLDGGTGTDRLEGGYGNDTYVFGRGYGTDTISDPDPTVGNQDVIEFTAGVAPNDVIVKRSGDNLELQINGTDDKLVIERYFSRIFSYGTGMYYQETDIGEDGNKVELVKFADGTVWTIADVTDRANTTYGTETADSITGLETDDIVKALGGDDTIYGNGGNDRIDGGDGNDKLYGGAGNDKLYGGIGTDTLDGGAGNDYMEGGTGNDTYIFDRGYGNDTISEYYGGDSVKFGANIAPSDITITRTDSKQLILSINGTTDTLTIQDYFHDSISAASSLYRVESFKFADGTIWNNTTIKAQLGIYTGTDGNDTNVNYGDQAMTAYGLAGDDTLNGSGYVDNLYGGDDNDTLYGQAGNDVLVGGNGDDRLYGGTGNDTFDGGAGNDYMEGNTGTDTYIFGLGYGNDTINEYYGVDTIQFGEGVDPSNVTITRTGLNGDLVLSVNGTTDSITIQNYFHDSINATNSLYRVENFKFADGTIWTHDTIKTQLGTYTGTGGNDTNVNYGDQALTVYGLAGDDTLNGYGYTDKLYGGDGNDVLYGQAGNDTLDGGIGNDNMEGGTGNDTYIFDPGYGVDTISENYGVDTIQFGAGVDPSNVTITRTGLQGDLVLGINGTADTLTVKNYFYENINFANSLYRVEQFKFADGTTWTHDNIKESLRTYTGTDGDDTNINYGDQAITAFGMAGDDTLNGSGYTDKLYGGDGNDVLYGQASNDTLDGGTGDDMLYGGTGNDTFDGGAGNDYMEGGTGNDIYNFGRGYGSDTVAESAGSDKLAISTDAAAVMFTRSGNDLQVTLADSSDNLLVKSWYTSAAYRVETFESSDGKMLASTQISQLIQAMASFSTNNNGMSWSQALVDKPQDTQAILAQYWTVPTV